MIQWPFRLRFTLIRLPTIIRPLPVIIPLLISVTLLYTLIRLFTINWSTILRLSIALAPHPAALQKLSKKIAGLLLIQLEQIGRASCREGGRMAVGAVSLKAQAAQRAA